MELESQEVLKKAMLLDTKNVSALWWEVIVLETKNTTTSFEVYDGDAKDLVGHK